MLFKVKNLGVIAEAEVDLSKDLILLTGQNNTGKTYLAYAIYWFLQMDFYSILSDTDTLYFGTTQTEAEMEIKKVFKKKKTQLLELLEKNKTHNQIEINIVELAKEVILPAKDELLKYILNIASSEYVAITDFFNGRNSFEPIIDLGISDEVILDNIATNISKKNLNLDGLVHITVEAKNNTEVLTFELMPHRLEDNELFAQEILIVLLHWSFVNFRNVNYCFTAERSAINIFSKELTLLGNKILRSKDKNLINFATERINRYPQPIKDSLDIAENLKDLTKKTSEFAYLAEELEKSILKGNIVVGEFDDLQYKPNGVENNLEIHLTSSLVKSLSPIAFYLRHLAQKNDCIIIDEPELNLHPDNQILVARFLGRLVNEGFKVIVSTHSDYIIKEINNLVMLSKESEVRNELLEKYGYSEKETIKPEQIEALLFRLPKNGGMVTPEKIAITPTGLSIKTIDEVIDKLDTMTENIYYKLFENKAN
jgi:predicted ATPase